MELKVGLCSSFDNCAAMVLMFMIIENRYAFNFAKEFENSI